MTIKHIDNGFVCFYNDNFVQSLTAQYNWLTEECAIEITCQNNVTYNWKCKEIIPSYNSLYGLAISENGSKVFVPTMNKGLFCFDIRDGAKLWNTRKHFKVAISKNDKLVCFGPNHISTYDYFGNELLHYRTRDYALNIENGYAIAMINNGYYSIMKLETLEIIVSIKASLMKMSSVVRIDLIGQQLKIIGFGFNKDRSPSSKYITYYVNLNDTQ